MVEDPKDSLYDLLNSNLNTAGYNIYKDDNLTKVTLVVEYDLPIETIVELLASTDVVITVKQEPSPKERLSKGTLMDSIGIAIEIWVIDKYTTGTRVVSANKIRWKTKDAIQKLLTDNVNTPGGDIEILRLIRDSDDDMTTTRPYLYHSIISINTIIYR